MIALINLIDTLINLFMIILFGKIILTWLFTFNVVSPFQQPYSQIYAFATAIVDPVLNPIRKFVPPIGGVDISPIILILGLYFIRNFLVFDLGARLIAG